ASNQRVGSSSLSGRATNSQSLNRLCGFSGFRFSRSVAQVAQPNAWKRKTKPCFLRYFFSPLNIFLELLCVFVVHGLVRVSHPQLLQAPRYAVLAKMRRAESAEGLKAFTVLLKVEILANRVETASVNITLGQWLSALRLEKEHLAVQLARAAFDSI